jgi:hypothetical protein
MKCTYNFLVYVIDEQNMTILCTTYTYKYRLQSKKRQYETCWLHFSKSALQVTTPKT